MINYGLKTAYTELVGKTGPGMSPVIAVGTDNNRARRTILAFWDNWQNTLQDLLDYATIAGGPYISRHTPQPFPGLTAVNGPTAGSPYLWLTKIDPIQGWGVPTDRNMLGSGAVPVNAGGTNLARYLYAHMTCHYESLPYDIYSDQFMRNAGAANAAGPDESSLLRYVIRGFSPAPQMITMPKGSMGIVPTPGHSSPNAGKGADQVNLAPPKLIPKFQLSLTHVGLPENAVNVQFINRTLSAPGAIDLALGKVNDAAFPANGPWKGAFAQGSLLYVACRIAPHINGLGARIFHVEHIFDYIANCQPGTTQVLGQNYFPYLIDQAVFGYVELSADKQHYPDTTASVGKHVFDATPFPPLFQAPSSAA